MATNQTPAKTTAPKAKKPAVPVSQRLVEQMKRGALQGKLNAAELDNLSSLATALKTFVNAG